MSSRLEFEVFGKVQRVFFRKYTNLKATELKLVGWCANTTQGTVRGVAEGKDANIDAFITFLSTEGSPKSRIDVDKCIFKRTEIMHLDKVYKGMFHIYRSGVPVGIGPIQK